MAACKATEHTNMIRIAFMSIFSGWSWSMIVSCCGFWSIYSTCYATNNELRVETKKRGFTHVRYNDLMHPLEAYRYIHFVTFIKVIGPIHSNSRRFPCLIKFPSQMIITKRYTQTHANASGCRVFHIFYEFIELLLTLFWFLFIWNYIIEWWFKLIH